MKSSSNGITVTASLPGLFPALALALILAYTAPALHAQSPGVTIRFAVFGDYGSGSANQARVAELVNQLDVDFIATTGDNAYGGVGPDNAVGQFYHSYVGNYQGVYGAGSPNNRYFPSMGNHDWTDGGGATAYFDFFTLPGPGVTTTGTSETERYYDVIQGPVHLFFLDSSPEGTANAPGDGRSPSSPQGLWLSNQVARSMAPWKLAIFHHPPYSSSSHGTAEDDSYNNQGRGTMKLPFEEWGLTAVLSGHDHVYERILKGPNNFPYFVTGLGGSSIYGLRDPEPGSEVRYNDDYGTMLITASSTNITFEFRSVNPSHGTDGLIDSYTLFAGKSNPGTPPPHIATFQNSYWPGYDRSRMQGINDIFLAGGHAYVAAGANGMLIMEADEPGDPHVVAGLDTGGDCQSVFVQGNLAYVLDGIGGLRVIDVTDPAAPMLVGYLPLKGQPKGVTVSGSMAVVASGTEGLQFIDVVDPTDLFLVSQVSRIGDASDVVSAGNQAFVAAGEAGFQIIDFSDQVNPVRVGAWDTSGSARAVGLLGHHAVVADGPSGLQVIDISDSRNPIRVGGLDTDGQALDLTVVDQRVFIADFHGGLKIIDLADPSMPVQIGHWETMGFARKIAQIGNVAWIANLAQGLEIVDLNDVAHPQLLGRLDTQADAEARDVEAVGNLAYVADGPAGLQIIDFHDSIRPHRIGHLATMGEAWDIELNDSFAYMAAGAAGLEIILVNNPSAPIKVGGWNQFGLARGLAVAGTMVFAACETAGLQIIDVSDPANPTRVGGFDTSGLAWDVEVADSIAYVSDGPAGLQIIDVSDPTNPVFMGRFGLVDLKDFEVVGQLGYGVQATRLWVVDLSDPSFPATVANMTLGGSTYDVEIVDDLAYVAHESQFEKIEIANPTLPISLRNWDAHGQGRGLKVLGDRLLLADGSWGLGIVSNRFNQAPVAEEGTLIVDEDAVGSGQLQGFDPEGDTLTYSLVEHGSLGSVNIQPNGSYSYFPQPTVSGTDTFRFQVSDGERKSRPATVIVTINMVNDRPVADAKEFSTEKGFPVNFVLSGSDEEEGPLEFLIAQPPLHGDINGTPPNLTYTPNADFVGIDTLGYQASDGELASEIATVTFLVATNEPPRLESIFAYGNQEIISITFNERLDPQLALDVFAYFIVPEGKPDELLLVLTASLRSDGRTVTLTTQGQVAGTSYVMSVLTADVFGNAVNLEDIRFISRNVDPIGDFYRDHDTFVSLLHEPQVIDFDDLQAPSTQPAVPVEDRYMARGVSFNPGASVYRLNRPHTLPNAMVPTPFSPWFGPTEVYFSSPVSAVGAWDISTAGVGLRVYDSAGNLLGDFVIDDNNRGAPVLKFGGVVFEAPIIARASFYGAVQPGAVGIDTLTWERAPNPTLPPAADAEYVIAEDQSLIGQLQAAGSSQGFLEFSIADAPSLGTVTIQIDGRFSYVPRSNVFGIDQFTFQISNGFTNSEPGRVTITIAPVNDPPEPIIQLEPLAQLSIDQPENLVISPNNQDARIHLDGSLSSDPDGDELTWAWFQEPEMLLVGRGIEIRPVVVVGQHTFTLEVSDGEGASKDSMTFQVITPCQAVNMIRRKILDPNLSENKRHSLLVLLDNACSSFDQHKWIPGLQQLKTFQILARAKFSDTHPDLGEALVQAAEQVIQPILAETRLIHIKRFKHQLQLTWEHGRLQVADTPEGPWRDLVDAVSPFTITPSFGASSKFYRVKILEAMDE